MSFKILIATGIYPPDIGGPATMIAQLRKSLIAIGHEVKILTYADEVFKEKDVYRIKRQANIFCRYLNFWFNLLWLSSWAQVVYVTDIYSVGYFAYLLRKFFGKKYIVRFAGDSAWEAAVASGATKDYIIDFQKKVYNKKIERAKSRRQKILVNASQVIVVSKFLAEVARLIGVKPEKISVVYNSVEFSELENFSTEKIDLIKNNFGVSAKIIVTACRLTPWKGVDGIIRILPKLIQEIGEVNLLVLGDGQELNKLTSLATELGVKEQVKFLGRIDRQEILNYFRAADLFILNSNYEGLSHALLEAMLAEVPIVATEIGGNPELITAGRQGLLVPYGDDKKLFEACLLILSDPGLAKNLSAQAKEKLKYFRWQNVVDETNKVFKTIINE
ncbi:MAG: glycosyltransferase family 4 protein [Candidatus Buchananbacteria bacterium]